MLSWPTKDPNEVLNYLVRWGPRIPEADAIANVVFTTISGSVVVESSSFDAGANTATVILSGGVVDEVCQVLCRITTENALIMDQTVQIRIKAR